jgi:hypothetical protein
MPAAGGLGPPVGDVLPGRRQVIAGAAAVVLALPLAGCLPGTDEDAPDRPDPDLLLRARVADEVRALAAQYAAVIARFPATADELSTLAAEHEEHARALLPRRVARTLTTAASPSGRSSPSSTPTPTVGTSLGAARSDLAVAETAAARRRSHQALHATPATGRLLASIAGCEAAHAALLAADR